MKLEAEQNGMKTGLDTGRVALLFSILLFSSHAMGAEVNLFSNRPVWEIKVKIPLEGVAQLRAHSRTDVRAEVEIGGVIYRDVAVHLKGTGSFQPVDKKPSLTLNFAKLSPGRNHAGPTKIYLNNSVQDASLAREILATELLTQGGVPAPRVGRAVVYLNGKRLGLYVLKEGFTPAFLGRYFSRNDGNFYDPGEAVDIDEVLPRKFGRSSDDRSELRRAVEAAAQKDFDERLAAMENSVDLERFVSLLALEVMIGHWDGYALGQNNYRVYHDPLLNKLILLPTGMDQVFGKHDSEWNPPMAGLLARAFMQMPEGLKLYRERFEELFRLYYRSDLLKARTDELLEEVRPYASDGEMKLIEQETEELKETLAAREEFLRQELAAPEPAPLHFVENRALVEHWKAVEQPGEGRMEKTQFEGKNVLNISAAGQSLATWRATVQLGSGRYRFEAIARAADVIPLPFGKHHGACLRVQGKAGRSRSLLDSGWETIEAEFEVHNSSEQVTLVCELRTAGGKAYFDRDSLAIVRISEGRRRNLSPELTSK